MLGAGVRIPFVRWRDLGAIPWSALLTRQAPQVVCFPQRYLERSRSRILLQTLIKHVHHPQMKGHRIVIVSAASFRQTSPLPVRSESPRITRSARSLSAWTCIDIASSRPEGIKTSSTSIEITLGSPASGPASVRFAESPRARKILLWIILPL